MHSTELRTAKILRTATALLSVQGITWVTSLVGVLVLPRFLGPSDFGLLASVGTAVILMLLVASFGTTNYLIKETARDPERTRELVLEAIVVRLAIWAALCLVLLPLVFVLTDSNIVRAVIVMSGVGGLFQLAGEALVSGFQGNQRLGRAALVLSTVGIVGQVTLVAVVVLDGGVIGAGLTGLSFAALSLALVCVSFFRTFRGGIRPSWLGLRRVARTGPPYLAWELGLRVYATLNMIMLPLLVNSTASGAFAVAYRLVTIPVFATTIITTAVYPALSTAAVQDAAWFRKVVTNAARLAFTVTAPMASGLAVLAPAVVTFVSGNEYDNAAILLVILAVHIPPAAVHTVLGVSLFARDLQRRMAFVAWGAVAFNLVANLALIPVTERLWGNGAIGAAVTALATEALVGSFVWRWSWAGVDGPRLIAAMLRVLAATCVMSAVAAAAHATGGLALAVPAGGLAYLLGCLAFGVFSAHEITKARETLSRTRAASSANP